MTQKELSYLEDAIEHEDNIIKICEESLNFLEDKSLIQFMNSEVNNHKLLRKTLVKLMEEKANEW